MRQALAESRKQPWPCGSPARSACRAVIRTAHKMGIRSPLEPYLSTALGASEVRLLELADAYRAIASGMMGEPHVIDGVTDAPAPCCTRGPGRATVPVRSCATSRKDFGVSFRLPGGTANALSRRDFPIPGHG